MTTIKSLRSDGTKRIYFICSNKLNKKNCLGTITIYAEDIENLIYTQILSKLSKINKIPKIPDVYTKQEIYNLKVKLAKTSVKINQLKNFLLSSELNIVATELVNSQAEQLYNEQYTLNNKLKLLQKKDYQQVDTDLLINMWTNASFEEKKAIGNIIIERINIFKNGDMEIVWNI